MPGSRLKNLKDFKHLADTFSDETQFDKQHSNKFRLLTKREIELLKKNGNSAEKWELILVSEYFDTNLIKNTEFFGTVRIGNLKREYLDHENLQLPVGIYNSLVISCKIGDNPVIRNVKYMNNYSIGDNCILFNIDEILGSTEKSKDEAQRIWISVGNENGRRKILSFPGILPADAFLWSRFRDDELLMAMLTELTDKSFLSENLIGNNCVINGAKIISDCYLGSYSQIVNVQRMQNVIVQSNENEQTIISDGCILKNAIIGFGNSISNNTICDFVTTGRNVTLSNGARAIHTFVGANSTISCCEVLNNLIFPFHEQHHNNSFLVASTIMGQSNIAAGATIGSNHNSRAADGEILAGRGFWPGLESSYKHNSVFSTFSLIAKGSYETELDVKLPFSLVSKSVSGNVQIFPAFWFRYNMYALARNSWKYETRDKRKIKQQHIEIDFLAPDTAQEMLQAINLLENAILDSTGEKAHVDETDFESKKELNNVYLNGIIPGSSVLVIKPVQAIRTYKMMLSYFAAREIAAFIRENPSDKLNQLLKGYQSPAKNWVNFGGQLISDKNYISLIDDIKNKKLTSWDEIHDRYDDLWTQYPAQKRIFSIYCWLNKKKKDIEHVSKNDISNLLLFSKAVSEQILKWTIQSREKDYSNPFRKMTFRSEAEMNAVLGKIKEDPFIFEMQKKHEQYIIEIDEIVSKLQTILKTYPTKGTR